MSLNNEKELAEKSLVNIVIQGNTSAFDMIIKNTEGLVVQIVFRMLSNTEDRKDVVQEIYLKVFKNLREFKFQSKLSTWIARIAYNTCVNHLEKKRLVLDDHAYEQDEKDDGSISHVTTVSEYHGPEEHIFRKELSLILNAEIEKLPSLYRTMIILYHQEDLSYTDIAQVTDLPVGTVKSYLFRARKKLKENILLQYKHEEL